MAKGSFDNEIRQAMTPDGGPPPSGQSASLPQSKPRPPANPPPQNSPNPRMIRAGAQSPMRMPQPASDPIGHAAAIAHAILQHGRVM